MSLLVALFIVATLWIVGRWQHRRRRDALWVEQLQKMRAAMDEVKLGFGEALVPVLRETTVAMMNFVDAANAVVIKMQQ